MTKISITRTAGWLVWLAMLLLVFLGVVSLNWWRVVLFVVFLIGLIFSEAVKDSGKQHNDRSRLN